MDDAAFHAVKLGAQQAVLASYGLKKVSMTEDYLDHYRDMVPRVPVGTPMTEAPGRRDPGVLKRLFSFNYKQDPSATSLLLDAGRHAVFGSPYTAYRQVNMLRNAPGANGGKAGLPRALAEYVKRFYWRRPNVKTFWGGVGLASQIYNVGNIGMDLYHAAKQDDPNLRNGDLASAAAGLVAAPFTSQLGLIGQPIHSAITQGVRKLVQKEAPPYTPSYNPVEHGKLVLRGMGAQNDLPVPDLST